MRTTTGQTAITFDRGLDGPPHPVFGDTLKFPLEWIASTGIQPLNAGAGQEPTDPRLDEHNAEADLGGGVVGDDEVRRALATIRPEDDEGDEDEDEEDGDLRVTADAADPFDTDPLDDDGGEGPLPRRPDRDREPVGVPG